MSVEYRNNGWLLTTNSREAFSVFLFRYPFSNRCGEPIVRVQQAIKVPTYIAQRDYSSGGLKIARGARFVALDSTTAGSLYISNGDALGIAKLLRSPAGDSVWAFNSGGRRVPLKMPEGPLFRRITEIGNQAGAFTAELIYSGLAGSVVRAVYREYVDNLARPAFTQELQYDLEADRSIAYKSLRLRLEEATNSMIRYTVISDDDLPWLPPVQVSNGCGGGVNTTGAGRS